MSFVGDGITTTVLVLLAQRDGPAGVALLLLANALPRLGGPWAGVLADRIPRDVVEVEVEVRGWCGVGRAVRAG